MTDSRQKIVYLTETAILLALLLLLSLTPLGYLRIFVVEITLMMIPVIIGATVIGPLSGLILGTAFGITSFLQCVTGTSAFGAAIFAISPLFAAIVCIPTRMLAGFLPGLLYRVLSKKDKKGYYAAFLSALAGTLLNTLLFTGMLLLCYWNSDYIQNLAAGKHLLAFAAGFVGINGLVEAFAVTAVSGAVTVPLKRAIGRHNLSHPKG